MLPSEPGELDLVVDKEGSSLGHCQPKLATEQPSASPPTAAKPLDNSPRGPSEITNLTHLQNEQASTRKADWLTLYPTNHLRADKKNPDVINTLLRCPVLTGPRSQTHQGRVKSNSFHEKTATLPSHPALRHHKALRCLVKCHRHPRKRAVAIRSGSTRNERAASATERAQNPGARRKSKRLRAKTDASGDARETLPIFRIGNSLALGRSLNPRALANGQCLQKERNTGWFCLEHADWPRKWQER